MPSAGQPAPAPRPDRRPSSRRPACRPGPVMRKSLAIGGRGRGQRDAAGQPGAAPGAHQYGEAAGVTAPHPGQSDDEPAGGKGSRPGSCPRGRKGCDAGFAAERGDGIGALGPGGKSPGQEGRRWPGPSRASAQRRRAGLPGGCMHAAQLRWPQAGPVPVSGSFAPAPRGGPERRRWRVPGWRVLAAGGAPGSVSGCGGRLLASPRSRLRPGRWRCRRRCVR